MKHLKIEPTSRADVPGVRAILEETQLFPAEMLEEMVTPFLNSADRSVWLTARAEEGPVGFCYAAPEEMTDGTWNMLALAVRPGVHRAGIGRAIVAALEAALRDQGRRILLVDTSSGEELAPARAFYQALGMVEISRIPDYWAAGEDKVTFLRRL